MSAKKDISLDLYEQCSICCMLVTISEAVLTENCNVICTDCNRILLEADQHWPSLDKENRRQL
jgi:hypothetical protein